MLSKSVASINIADTVSVISCVDSSDSNFGKHLKEDKVSNKNSIAQLKQKKADDFGCGCLSVEVVRKMLEKFLYEKRILQERLAQVLEVRAKDLENIFSQDVNIETVQKINLPLIKLYCETKF